MKTCPGEAVAFLDALWEVLETEEYLELRPLHPARPPHGSPALRRQLAARRWFTLPQARRALPAALAWCADKGLSAYFGVLPRTERGRGGAAHTGPGAAVWADLDIAPAQARARLARMPVAPSIEVETGRGLHAYWLLSEPEPPERCEALSKRLAHLLDADRSAADRARILRLPGSRNPKHAGSPLARLTHLDADRRYHAVDLDSWLPEPPVPKAAPPQAVRPEQLLSAHGPARALGLLRSRAEQIAATPAGGGPTSNGGDPGPGRNNKTYAAGRLAARLHAATAVNREECRKLLVGAAVRAGLSEKEATAAFNSGWKREEDLGGGRPRPHVWSNATGAQTGETVRFGAIRYRRRRS